MIVCVCGKKITCTRAFSIIGLLFWNSGWHYFHTSRINMDNPTIKNIPFNKPQKTGGIHTWAKSYWLFFVLEFLFWYFTHIIIIIILKCFRKIFSFFYIKVLLAKVTARSSRDFLSLTKWIGYLAKKYYHDKKEIFLFKYTLSFQTLIPFIQELKSQPFLFLPYPSHFHCLFPCLLWLHHKNKKWSSSSPSSLVVPIKNKNSPL